jgi:hypothetical protein
VVRTRCEYSPFKESITPCPGPFPWLTDNQEGVASSLERHIRKGIHSIGCGTEHYERGVKSTTFYNKETTNNKLSNGDFFGASNVPRRPPSASSCRDADSLIRGSLGLASNTGMASGLDGVIPQELRSIYARVERKVDMIFKMR